MFNLFRTAPVATLVTVMTALLAILVYVQSTGVVTGQAATVMGLAAGIINVLLGLYARSQVTPVADPKDADGRALAPVERGNGLPGSGGW
jgi:hypothetical protein